MRKRGLPQKAWVLVADGEKALFLENIGDAQDMHLSILRKKEQDNPKAQDWATGQPGRFNDGPSVHRSAVDDTDWHVLEKERFASDLADMLYGYAHAGRFTDLVIVASAEVLSTLRDEMHKEVADRVVMELPKVLTNHPVDEIERHLSTALTETA